MAITMRIGLEKDFIPERMSVGELAISTDTGLMRYCHGPNKIKLIATDEDIAEMRKMVSDFDLTVQQALADIGNLGQSQTNRINTAGQTQTQRVNTAGDTQVSRIQAEGTTQVQNVQATAAEISADREQIHTNRDNTARLQRTTAGAIMRSAEGSFITVTDAADEMGFRRIEIEGETRQVTTTGAQMIDFEQCLKNWKSQYTQVGGRVYKITAIGTGYQAPVAFSESDIKVTLSGIIRDLSGSGYRVDLIDSSGNIVGRINKDIKSITGLASKIRLNFAEAGAGEYSDIMLNAGSAALPWEPYTGSKPSPSPEYPQELENVGKQNTDGKYAVKVTATKTQLLDTRINFWAQGAINTGGAESENAARIRTTGKTHVDPKQIYTLNISDGYYIAYHQYDKNEEYISDSSWIASYPHIMVLNKNTNYVKFTVYKEGNEAITPAVINNGLKIMLNVGSAPLPWEPYRGHTATITSDRPLTKLDKLTCRDGVWGWRCKSVTTIYDGSADEMWLTYYNESEGTSFQIKAADCALKYNSSICNRYKNMPGAWKADYKGEYGIYSDNVDFRNKYFRRPNAEIATIEEWRAWLAESPITLQYETQDEEWVPLSAEEQAAMNALCTYAGTTHIWTDDPLQPVISLDYTVDTEGYIKDTTPAYRDVERFALTGEVSGTVATCTDSAEWPLLGVGMLGKCEQVSTTGAQLLDWNNLTKESCVPIEEGVVRSNITGGYYCALVTTQFNDYILTHKDNSLTLSCKNNPSGSQVSVAVYGTFQGEDKTVIESNKGSNNATIVIPGNILTVNRCEFRFNRKGTVFTDTTTVISDIMLNAGSTALPWEPYTGAAPSPSPAYKQEIQETGTYNPETGMYEAVWRQRGAQLLDLEQWLVQTGAPYTIDDSGVIITGHTGLYSNPFIFAKTDTEVTLSGTLEVITGTNYRFDLLDKDSNVVGKLYSGSKPITAIASKIRLNYSYSGNLRVSDIMLNTGSTALPWEPYQSDTLRLTADQPWRGIGDVHDEVCDRDGVLGTWRRYAGEILDGSEDEAWRTTGCSEASHKRFYSNLVKTKAKPAGSNAKVEPILCTAYKAMTANDTYLQKQGISVEIDGTIAVYDDGFSPDADVNGFKARLAEYPITVVYQLKEPYFEPFPDEIQRAYRKLKSYAGTTHAWVDDPLQPEVSFRYVKDSKLILGKLEDRLTALEAGQAQTAAAFSYLPPEIQAEMIETETRELMNSI